MIDVRPFVEADAPLWDAFCVQAEQATLLHTRRFLNYHGDRFVDRSVLIYAQNTLLGLLPAAVDPHDPHHVVSHPGITYGGVIHQGALRGERMIQAMRAMADHWRRLDYTRLTYKAVPTFYHQRPSQDDLYALFRLGARRIRCDLSSTIDLTERGAVSERRRRSLKKAQKAGVQITTGFHCLPAFWEVLTENLARKHGVAPVHTLEAITWLAARFPDQMQCVCAEWEGQVVAGILLFRTPGVDHAQYIAARASGYQVSALDLVFEHSIAHAHAHGKRWFDFGISTEAQGTRLNEHLYKFKTEFGAGGTVHEFYEMQLENF